MYKDCCSSIGSALFEPVTMRDNGIELRHLRVITGEHIGSCRIRRSMNTCARRTRATRWWSTRAAEEAVTPSQRYPMTMVSTDTGSYAPGEGHPQIAGSFPRAICAKW